MILLLMAAALDPQAAPATAQHWSVLAPTTDCTPTPGQQTDIVVCGKAQGARLPLPDERPPPDHPMPSNPDVTGIGALAAQGTPCSAVQSGCTVGVGPPPELVNAAVTLAKDTVGAIKGAFKAKPDKSRRVAIPLDDDAPQGRLLP